MVNLKIVIKFTKKNGTPTLSTIISKTTASHFNSKESPTQSCIVGQISLADLQEAAVLPQTPDRGLKEFSGQGVQHQIHPSATSLLQDVKLKGSITGVGKVLLLQLKVKYKCKESFTYISTVIFFLMNSKSTQILACNKNTY